jgi:hypothetical protein
MLTNQLYFNAVHVDTPENPPPKLSGFHGDDQLSLRQVLTPTPEDLEAMNPAFASAVYVSSFRPEEFLSCEVVGLAAHVRHSR